MALWDHYLIEDREMLAVHLEILHKTSMKTLEGAMNGNFADREQVLIDINRSLKTLAALNAKKKQRDEYEKHNNAIYERRGVAVSERFHLIKIYVSAVVVYGWLIYLLCTY